MTPEEKQVLIEQIQQQQGLDTQTQSTQPGQTLQSMQIQQAEKSMSEEQLDLDKVISGIEYLLRGMKKTKVDGVTKWVEPEDKEMKVLSEHGVQLIINTIRFYLNKNTLLSNYDESTINQKMEDFATELADAIFMSYEKVFYYPSEEECQEVLLERLKRKKEQKIFSLELRGEKSTPEGELKIEKDLINEIYEVIPQELQKIKEQLIKDRLKRFPLILRTVQDSVHSTYLRAWKGQERETLRRHIHISENRNPLVSLQQPQSRGLFGRFRK